MSGIRSLNDCLPMWLVSCAILCLATFASAQQQTVVVLLDSAHQVPPNTSSGTGTAVVQYDATTNFVSVTGTYTGLVSDQTAVHLHGPAGLGTNGGVLIGLTGTGGTSGTFSGSGTLSPANMAALLGDNTYINIHTVSFGGGEIRGQLQPSQSTHLDWNRRLVRQGNNRFALQVLVGSANGRGLDLGTRVTLTLAGQPPVVIDYPFHSAISGGATCNDSSCSPDDCPSGSLCCGDGTLGGTCCYCCTSFPPNDFGSNWLSVTLTPLPGAVAEQFANDDSLARTGPAATTSFGAGCAGASGPLLVSSLNLPAIGSAWHGRMQHMPANGAGFFVLGWGVAHAGIPLDTIGATGCRQYVLADVSLFALADGSGNAGYTLDIPNSTSFFAVELGIQGAALDPAANSIGVATSNGLLLTIGT